MVYWYSLFRVITNIISSLVKSFREEWLSFLLRKKINNALKEKTLSRPKIEEKLEYQPATFESVEVEKKRSTGLHFVNGSHDRASTQ